MSRIGLTPDQPLALLTYLGAAHEPTRITNGVQVTTLGGGSHRLVQQGVWHPWRLGKVQKLGEYNYNLFVTGAYTPDELRQGPAPEWGIKLSISLLLPGS